MVSKKLNGRRKIFDNKDKCSIRAARKAPSQGTKATPYENKAATTTVQGNMVVVE